MKRSFAFAAFVVSVCVLSYPVNLDAAQPAPTGGDAYYLDGKAQDIGHQLQPFLDLSSYADRWDVYRRVNEPAKHPANPVVMPDQPWEAKIGLPNVLYDEKDQMFRMWYANYDRNAKPTANSYRRFTYMISYAVIS